MSFSYDRLQAEQVPWVQHNFGNRPAHQPLLGMAEELGELLEAQKVPDCLDACADFMIFASDYCNARGWSFVEIVESSKLLEEEIVWLSMIVKFGRLAHAHLKDEQGIRVGEDHVAAAKTALASLVSDVDRWATQECDAINRQGGLLGVVEETWEKVRLRDWKKYPTNGRTA